MFKKKKSGTHAIGNLLKYRQEVYRINMMMAVFFDWVVENSYSETYKRLPEHVKEDENFFLDFTEFFKYSDNGDVVKAIGKKYIHEDDLESFLRYADKRWGFWTPGQFYSCETPAQGKLPKLFNETKEE